MKFKKQPNLNTYGYIEGWLSIVINTLLFIIKYAAGISSGSIALIADAWHSLSDSLTSLVLLVGLKLSARPADKDHPFGHGRIELIAALIIGILLGIVALHFFYDSIIKLYEKKSARYGLFAIIAIVISIALKELLALFAIWAGKKTDSKSLIAEGWHHRSDSISSILILIGLLAGKNFWWIDGVLGIVVALVLFYTTYKIILDSISPILGEKPPQVLIEQIELIANSIGKRNVQVHHVHVHHYGKHKEVTFHIKLPSSMHLDEAHLIATQIEQTIQNKIGVDATIHIEPIDI